MFFLSPEIYSFFSESGNNLMRALGRKKHIFFFDNARPKSNARAHLKQRKKLSGLKVNNKKRAKPKTLHRDPSGADLGFEKRERGWFRGSPQDFFGIFRLIWGNF